MTEPRESIVHICTRGDWEEAKKVGEYRAASLESEGFIHCSRSDQVLTVVNCFYADVPDLVLLWIDSQRVEVEIRWEPADGDVFPHLYGALNVEAVDVVKKLVPDSDGVYRTLP
ncbi:MAG: DUF952 domain-containing protein [Anaerolineales bacterium]|nr:DUF952 domain-containing protein [Anaerolineales bacterium]